MIWVLSATVVNTVELGYPSVYNSSSLKMIKYGVHQLETIVIVINSE